MNTEYNKLMAEFMGSDFINVKIFINRLPKDFLNNSDSYKCFHNSWDWLMAVLEQIRSKEVYNNCLNNIECLNDYKDLINEQLITLNIQAVYSACVEFIKWYNEQNK